MKVIRLVKGYARLTNSEYNKFEKGDTIWGDGSSPEELNRWVEEDEAEALKALEAVRCSYSNYNSQLVEVEEYALEHFTVDEDGEFADGSDYQMSECKKFVINVVQDKNCNPEYIAIVGGEEVTTTSEDVALIFDSEIDAKNYMNNLKDNYDFLEVVEIF